MQTTKEPFPKLQKKSRSTKDNLPKQLKKVQNEVIKQETKKQPKKSGQRSNEGLLFLYVILFLKPGALNIFHPIAVQKFMENISIMFVRENKINCMICATNMPNNAINLVEHIQSSEHREKIIFLEYYEQSIFHILSDQFSDLRLAREIMCRISDEVHCFVCTAKLPNKDFEIGQHIESAKHKKTRAKMLETVMDLGYSLVRRNVDNWYDVDNYSCVICEKLFVSEIKFFYHLTSNGHKHKVVTGYDYFDFCDVCSYSSFGEDFLALWNHPLSHRHEFNLKTKKYLVPEMPERARKALRDVNGFVWKIVNFVVEENLDIAELAMSNLITSKYRRGTIPLEEIELEQVPSCLNYTIITSK